MITTFNSLGLLHSYNDQPSLVDHYGVKYWHINGKLERHGNLPCVDWDNGDTRYSLDNGNYKMIGKPYCEETGEWYFQGFYEIYEKYFNSDNQYHRLNGPAWIEYYKNGNIKKEAYCIDGKLNRLDGPAEITYYENKQTESEHYYIDGRSHRLDGPAHTIYFNDGRIECEFYYLNNQQMSKETFVERSKKIINDTINQYY